MHAEDWDTAVKICSKWVSDEAALRFAQEFCLFGTAQEITERLRELHATGVTGVFLQHVGSYDLPTELIESVGSTVLPAMRPGAIR
ncbi:hypothetical protein PS467_00375 [Streptomyces luomodiensis]|uniref:Luciferase-like domain-containing protein n=1 Tax=Streptomyces luomodiensis TaxID=3026192 RepID=A0ABY9VAE2_9ACTN|nr:hypothetical protein [Streptomyces sp. SCA4-21]WNF01863.1 hypothetical protein PS467_00375 [Streptomyces sp. SCA4-21]